jgi:YVTN family beta-propeller protein
MGYLQESGTRRLRPAGRRIAGVFLLVAALVGGCNVLGVILLSGCLDYSERYYDQTIYYKSTQFYFTCDKTESEYSYTIFDQNFKEVGHGPVPTRTCIYALAEARNRVASGEFGASSVLRGPANRSSAAGNPTNLVYILDVGNFNAIQILNPSTVTLTEVDLPGGAASAYPVSMDMTPDGKSLWVAQVAIQQNGGGIPPQPPRITIMDTASQTFTSSFNLPAGISPNTVLFSPDGTTAYVSNDSSPGLGASGTPANSSVLALDVASQAVVKTIATPKGAGRAVMTPDGLLLYTVENTNGIGASALTVIDAITNTVATSVSLPNGAIKLFINPSGTRLYIVSQLAIGVFDTATNQQVASIPTVGFSTANNWASFSPDDRSVWFCNCGFGAFYQVDQRTNQLIQTKQVAGQGVGFMFGLTQ